MTTSAEATSRAEVPIPPGLPAMGRLFRLGLRHEPTLLVFAVVITIAYAIPDAMIALWLKMLADGLDTDQTRLVVAAMIGLAASTSMTWVLGVTAERMTRRFRDKITIALERHVAGLQAGVGTIAHQERPDYLDRLAVLRHETYVLDLMYTTVLGAIGWLVRVVITLALLALVHPALIGLALLPHRCCGSAPYDRSRNARSRNGTSPVVGSPITSIGSRTRLPPARSFASPASGPTWCADVARSGTPGSARSPPLG